MNRRQLLSAAATLPLLAACAQLGQVSNIATVGAQLAADVQGIATSLSANFPAIAAALTGDAANKVQTGLGQLAGLAAALNATLTTTAAQPTVAKVIAVIGDIASVAGPLLPPPWGLAMMAAQALLPIIGAGVGLLTNAGPAAGPLTPAEARRILGIPTVA